MTFLKTSIYRPLIILTVLAVALNIGRIGLSGRVTDLYLSWNIFLALLPLAASAFIVWYVKREKVYATVVIFAGLAWLALFPNAPYILTDFIHLRAGRSVMIWYDIFMFFAAAWVGLLAAFYSLMQIETLLRNKFSNAVTWVFVSLVFLLSSFGIYIGRELRWNSWDVFVNPHELIVDTFAIFTKNAQHQDAPVFIALFFVFTLVAYIAWRPVKI